jgi:ATP-binding cassette subfamily B protein
MTTGDSLHESPSRDGSVLPGGARSSSSRNAPVRFILDVENRPAPSVDRVLLTHTSQACPGSGLGASPAGVARLSYAMRPPGREKLSARTGRSDVRATLRAAVAAVGPNRKRLIALTMLSIVGAVVETVAIYLVARLAASITTNTTKVPFEMGPARATLSVSSAVLATVALLVFLLALALPIARLSAGLSEAALRRARTRVVNAYLAASWASRSADREGLFQDLAGDYSQRTERLVQQFSTILLAGSGLLIMGVGAIVVAPLAALIGVVAFGSLVIVLRPIGKQVRRGAQAFMRTNNLFSAHTAQTARLGQEIAAYSVAPAVAEILDEEVRSSARMLQRVRFANTLTPMAYQYGALLIVVGTIGIARLISPTYLTLLAPVILMLIRILSYARQLQGAVQSSSEYGPFVELLEEEIGRLRRAQDDPGFLTVTSASEFRFEDVTFSYLPGEVVLAGVSFGVARGEAIALIGPSGGGKTTLVQLLLRLRAPDSGLISAGDLPLSDVLREQWSAHIGFVPQDNKLIAGTVADNIRFYRPWFDLDAVEQAARAAHVHDEILRLPGDYACVVGPGMREFSGGQRQRIGIARALVGKPDLLVMDEPTSALDARSEELLTDTLAEMRGQVTMLLVAHRPATIRVCDRVYRLVDGVLQPVSHQDAVHAVEHELDRVPIRPVVPIDER